MKIGIIGAGHIGGTLAFRLVTLGHDVSVANSRGPDSLRDLAKQSGATPVTESRWVSGQLGRPVIKVFNNIYAQHLMERGKPAGTAGRIALPVSGDDPRAKQVVMRLVEDLGFDAVDAGKLDESWRQQPGNPVYAADLDAAGVRKALGQANKERSPEWKA